MKKVTFLWSHGLFFSCHICNLSTKPIGKKSDINFPSFRVITIPYYSNTCFYLFAL